jgi:hypothetical protein
VTGVGYYSATLNLKPTGAVTLSLLRVDGAGQATIAGPVTVAGLTVAPGDKLDVRLIATGTSPTTLMAKVWRDGAAEPTTWQVSGSDASAAMQKVGSVGLMYYLSTTSSAPVVANIDGLRVYDSTTTANAAVQAKVAALATQPAVVHQSQDLTAAQRMAPQLVVRRNAG